MVARPRSRRLSELGGEDLLARPAWRVTGDPHAADVELEPVDLVQGFVSADVGEVWCLCTATFADGSTHHASALCRGDSDFGPRPWSFMQGPNAVRLLLPPAPQFVLDQEGPVFFAGIFGRSIDDVFPIQLRVVPQFATPPRSRSILLTIGGPVSAQHPGRAAS